MTVDILKTCTKCLLKKSTDQFHKATNSKGLSYHCKSCIAVRDKNRYIKCREEVQLWSREIYSGKELDYQLELVRKMSDTDVAALRAKLNKVLGKTLKVDRVKYNQHYYTENKDRINAANKLYYENNKEKMLTWQKQYVADHPEQTRKTKSEWQKTNFMQKKVQGCKTRANKAGLPFNLKKDELVVPEFCPILGIPLYLSETGSKCANSPSIDRVINDLGYTKENVQIISDKANTMKSDASPVELLLFAFWVLNTFDPEIYLKENT